MKQAIKKLTALLLALTVILSSSSFVNASTASQQKLDKLVELSVIKGDANGVNGADTMQRYRSIVMMIRLKGLEADLNAFDYVGKPTFTDAAGKSEYIQRVMSYLKNHPELGVIGYTDGSFKPFAVISPKEHAKIMLEVLGYKFETDYSWATVTDKALAIGLVSDPAQIDADPNFTLADLATFTYDSLILNIKGQTDKNLGEVLGFVIQATPVATFALGSVTAPNARQIVLNFNKDINEDTLTTDNVKVYINGETTVTTYTKAVDGKTVTLGLSAAVAVGQDTDVKVVIKNVEAKANATEKLSETTQVVRMKDITAPAVTSIVATTSKTFTITSSEPLAYTAAEANFHVLANITIDGVKLVARITPDYAANTATVELGSKLAVGNHAVVIDGYKDIVGFAAPKFEGTLVVATDASAPALVSVDTVNRATVKLNFNEPVATLGTILINGQAVTGPVASADKKTYTVTLAAGFELGYANLIKTTVSYVGTTDMEGNSVTGDAKTFDFVAADDLVAPTATITMKTNNSIQIVFSEVMSATGTMTVKDSKGVTVGGIGALVEDTNDTSHKTFTATTGITDSATYTVELKDAKDNSVRTNAMTTTTVTLSTFDNTAPSISSVVTKTAYVASPLVNGQATIYFSEAMDVASITNLTNYLVDYDGAGASASVQLSTVTGALAVAAADAKSVVLTIPGSGYVAGTTTLYVLAVKDAAGTLILTADFNAVKTIAATPTALTVSAADAIATNKIKVTFGNAMAAIDPSEFKVYKNDGATLAFVGIAYELDSTSKIATITLNGNLTNDAEAIDADGLAKVAVAGVSTKDIFGSAAIKAATVVVDKIAPSVSTIATGTLAGEIKVSFSEAVGSATFTEALLTSDLIIKDADGVVINPTGNIVYTLGVNAATVNSATGFDAIVVSGLTTGKVYTVELIARNVKDLAATPVLITAKAATSVTAK